MKWNKPTILCSISLQQVFPRNQNQNQGYSHEGMKKAELNFIAFSCKIRQFSHIYYSPPIFEYEKKSSNQRQRFFHCLCFHAKLSGQNPDDSEFESFYHQIIVNLPSNDFSIVCFLNSDYSEAIRFFKYVRHLAFFWKKMRFSGNKTCLCSKSRMRAIIL